MASDSKKELSLNGSPEVNPGVELSDVTFKEIDEKPKEGGSVLQTFLKLLLTLICGFLFGVSLEKGRGESFC